MLSKCGHHAATALILGLVLRVVPVFGDTFTAVGIKFTSPDSYHFAYNALNGIKTEWGAVLSFIVEHSPLGAELALVLVPLVVFALTIPAVYLLARMIFNSKVAGLAVIAFAVIPGEYLGRSVMGDTDRHVFEVFVVAWTAALLVLLVKKTWRHMGFYAAVFVLAVAVYLYLPWPGIMAYFGFMSSGYSNLTSEARTIFYPFAFVQVANVAVTLSIIYLIARRRTGGVLTWGFIGWTLAVVLLTAWQRRFDYLLILNLSILCGYGLIYLAERNQIKVNILVALFVLVTGVFSFKSAQSNDYRPSDEWVTNLKSLSAQPPGEVLTWWDYGNWIRYYSAREPYIDPGQSIERIKQAARYLVTGEGRPDVEYLIVDEAMVGKFLPAILTWAGEEPRDYVYPVYDRLVFTDKYNSLFVVRLYDNAVGGYTYLAGDKVKVYKVDGG